MCSELGTSTTLTSNTNAQWNFSQEWKCPHVANEPVDGVGAELFQVWPLLTVPQNRFRLWRLSGPRDATEEAKQVEQGPRSPLWGSGADSSRPGPRNPGPMHCPC